MKKEGQVLLTQEQVDALPEGADVFIIWSGGNGPHKYFIKKWFGRSVAYTKINGKEINVQLLDCAGEHPRDQVWLAEQPTTPKG